MVGVQGVNPLKPTEYWDSSSVNVPLSVQPDYKVGLPAPIRKVGCEACKAVSWVSRNLLGSKPVQDIMYGVGIIFCDVALSPLVGYERAACKGIIEDQWSSSLYPILVKDFIGSETNFCAYFLDVCDKDKWT